MNEDVVKELATTFMIMIFCLLIVLPISILVLVGIGLFGIFIN